MPIGQAVLPCIVDCWAGMYVLPPFEASWSVLLAVIRTWPTRWSILHLVHSKGKLKLSWRRTQGVILSSTMCPSIDLYSNGPSRN